VQWVLGSERVWGTEKRRYCISFSWRASDEPQFATGTYCRNGGGVSPDQASIMLKEIDFHVK
jgi:hypothetical protein